MSTSTQTITFQSNSSIYHIMSFSIRGQYAYELLYIEQKRHSANLHTSYNLTTPT